MTLRALWLIAISVMLGGFYEAPDAEAQSARSGRQSKQKARPNNSKSGGGQAGVRERHVVREQKVGRGSTDISFDETNLLGRRRAPLGTMINQGGPDKDFDLIKIRRHWKPEMVQSASSLESGRTQ